jgi:hypothetical protein
MDKYDANAYTDDELYEIVGYNKNAAPPENLEEILIDKLKRYMYSRMPGEIKMFNFIKNIYIRFFDEFAATESKTDDFKNKLPDLEKVDYDQKEAVDTTGKYDIKNYTDSQLYNDILDVSPTALTSEKEAKIIQLLDEYKRSTTPKGKQIFAFYSDIYSHFFNPTQELNAHIDEAAPTDTPEITVGKDAPNNLTYTTTLEYSKGKINPILKETYRRIISIDSQYRDAEYLSATDFTLNITETLKDVVSLKLYAVQIPVTWYTISNNYGSNYFMIKPTISDTTLAISDNIAHEYKVEIPPGNYTQKTLTDKITSVMGKLNEKYTDVSFGETTFTYGEHDAKSVITIDIQKVYNESYYDMILGTKIKSLLNMQDVSINSFYSSKPLSSDGRWVVDSTNNRIFIDQYLPDRTLETVTIELTAGANLDIVTIVHDLNTKLSEHPSLYNSSIRMLADQNCKCSIYLNRYKFQNMINAKLRVRFPNTTLDVNNQATDGSARILWQSGFNFPPNSVVLTDIITTNVLDQTLEIQDETVTFRPKYDISGGVYISETDHTNDIVLRITNGLYTVDRLITHLTELISQNPILYGTVFTNAQTTTVRLSININKVYTSKDYRIVFYDIYSFTKCTRASNSYRNATADTTLGYILGYKELAEYNLTKENLSVSTGKFLTPDFLTTGNNYTFTETTAKTRVTLEGDSVLSIYLYNYFMIILDDFNQNHLNDGLVTVSKRDTSVTLPGYANRRKLKACDAITGKAVDSTSTSTSSFPTQGLTVKQVYSIEQILATQNKAKDVMNAGPFIKDMFALLPIKASGAETGSIYVEFGGTLQQQERVYFGPVNVNRLSVKLINDKGDVVDLNGANWSFQLVCEQLYQKGAEI